MILRGLARFARVDVLYVGEVQGVTDDTPESRPVQAEYEWPLKRAPLGLFDKVCWVLRPTEPLQVLEWGPLPDRYRASLPPYDVSWCFGLVAHKLTEGAVEAVARIVDLSDLEDSKLRLAREAGIVRRTLRRRLADRLNATAWRKYQASVARRVDAMSLCSESDREELGAENAHVVPNGFPATCSGAWSGTRSPVLIFVGLFEYEPNADGAEFFVEEILPRIRSQVPDARLRLVGAASARTRCLDGEAVSVVGEVPDLAAEYSRASVAVVPIRFGGGTRIKIIEAFARRVPVVSTSIGAMGLGATSEQQLLMADDPEGFAEACVRLLREEPLRQELVAQAASLYKRQFSQSAVTRAVGRVLGSIGHPHKGDGGEGRRSLRTDEPPGGSDT